MVEGAIYKRSMTDKQISVLWVVGIILLIVIEVIAVIVAMFMVFDTTDMYGTVNYDDVAVVQVLSSAASFAVYVIMAALVYWLVKRQNDHYEREAELRSALTGLIRSAAWSPGRMNDILPESTAMSTVERRQEQPRIVWFWVLVILLPPVISVAGSAALYLTVLGVGEADIGNAALFFMFAAVMLIGGLAVLILELYLLYFLTKTMIEHDRRWNFFAYNARRAMSKLGFPEGRPFRTNQLPDRSMALYIVVTIFTGIFLFYWLYVLIKDPNDHFAYQAEFEDNVLSAISPQQTATPSASRP